MIFWIFVIIAAIAFIIICLPYKGELAHKALIEAKDAYYEEYDEWEFPWRTVSKEQREKQAAAWSAHLAAEKKLREFEEKTNIKRRANRKETIDSIACGFLIGALVIIIIMSIVMMCDYISAPATRAKLEAEYEVLSWEVENNIYVDNGDDVVGKKELYNQVRDWNANLATHKVGEKNFWYGIFIPNIYHDLQFIELP